MNVDFLAGLGLGALALFGALFVAGLCRAAGKKAPEPEAVKPNPCANGHDFLLTGAKPATIQETRYTTVMYRCSRCGIHLSNLHPGTFDIADFERTRSEIKDLEDLAR